MNDEFPIDLILEAPLSLPELANRFAVDGRKPHPHTLARHALKGILAGGRRILLPSILIGGRRCSSDKAFRWFVSQVTVARRDQIQNDPSSPSLPGVRSPAERQRASERAAAELKRRLRKR